MNIGQIKASRFLTKADCGKGILVTIKGDVTQENVAMDNQPEELKYILNFHETEKGMVLNTVNAQLIAKICGSDDTSDWNGHKIVLYDDPSITFGGRLVGGIRARAPRNQAPAAPAARPAPAPPAPRPAPPAPHQAPAALPYEEGGAVEGDDVPF